RRGGSNGFGRTQDGSDNSKKSARPHFPEFLGGFIVWSRNVFSARAEHFPLLLAMASFLRRQWPPSDFDRRRSLSSHRLGVDGFVAMDRRRLGQAESLLAGAIFSKRVDRRRRAAGVRQPGIPLPAESPYSPG